MAQSITNMNQVWMDTNTRNSISMSVSTMGNGASANSSLLVFNVDGDQKFRVDANGSIKQKTFTVSTLPSASILGVGSRAFVTDATSTTFASTVAGSGSNKVPVYSNGTHWLIG